MKYQKIYNRLRRIEGQIRGIEEMVGKERSETEILVQLEAVKSSVSSTIGELIETMLQKKENGEVVLKDREVSAVMRLIKR